MKTFWNGLSHEQWSAKNRENCDLFLDGKSTLVLPSTFWTLKQTFGKFIQIQPCCLLGEEPSGFFVRDTYYGPMLKVMIPLTAKAGDTIRIVKKSHSGKSYVAEVVQ